MSRAEAASPAPLSPVRARRRGAYLDAAEAALAGGERWGELSVAALAARAGFSRASFYAYFTDKAQLAVTVAARFEEQLLAGVGGWLRGEDRIDVEEALGRALATFHARRGAVLLVSEAAATDEALAAVWRAIHTEFETLVAARLGAGGPARGDADRRALAHALVWATEGVLTEHLRTGHHSDRALTAALSTLWRGVFPRG